MVLRIEETQSDPVTLLMLSGKLIWPDVLELKTEIAEAASPVALDLNQVGLVDLDAVQFLLEAERRGIELRHVPKYVREWMYLERPRRQ